MDHPSDTPTNPRPHHEKDYEDPGYHDDIDVVPADDVERPAAPRPTPRRQPGRRLPPPRRRHYED
jgi:hypothetical protein